MWRADLVVQDRRGAPALVVEVKNRTGLDAAVAQEIAANVADRLPPAWFMLASQDRAFVWHLDPSRQVGRPAVEFSLAGVVARYEPRVAAGYRLHHEVLSMVLIEWLNGLCAGASEPQPEVAAALGSSGLLADLRDGAVRVELSV